MIRTRRTDTIYILHQFFNDKINQSTNFGKLLFLYKFTWFLQLLSFGLVERFERKFRTQNPNFTFTFSHNSLYLLILKLYLFLIWPCPFCKILNFSSRDVFIHFVTILLKYCTSQTC